MMSCLPLCAGKNIPVVAIDLKATKKDASIHVEERVWLTR